MIRLELPYVAGLIDGHGCVHLKSIIAAVVATQVIPWSRVKRSVLLSIIEFYRGKNCRVVHRQNSTHEEHV